jgi:hypothetical protein
MDLAPAGRPTAGTPTCSFDLARDGSAEAENNQWQPHLQEYWAIPPEPSAEFVAAREDVLAV